LWRGRRHGIEKAQSEATGFLHAFNSDCPTELV
jgi:hypothetical protein